MDISKTARYALRLMSYIASSEKVFHTTSELHSELGIPRQYLRRLMTTLSKKGLLTSDKGRTGGFSMARPKKEIFLSDIIGAVDDSPFLQSCVLGFDNCRLSEKCPLHDKWAEVRELTAAIFQRLTLADMNIKMNRELSSN